MKRAATIVVLSMVSSFAYAEFTFKPSLETGVITQSAKERNSPRRNLETISIDPGLIVEYNSKYFTGRWIGNSQYLIRSGSGESFEDSFPEYRYNADLEIIERVLSFSANGSLNYRNLQPSGYLVSDRFLDQENLSKNRSNNIRSTLNLSRFPLVEFTGSAGYSDVDAEQRNFQQNNLASETFSLSSQISQGSVFKDLIFDVDSSFQSTNSTSDTQQTRGRATNFDSRTIDANLIYRLIGNFGLSARARIESNKYDGLTTSDSSFNYDSYGAGIAYVMSPNRSISVTANVSDEEGEDSDNFVGVDLNWALSGRSQISGSYGRRFFGESGSFQFRYNSKALRARIQYTESLTTFSRLIASVESQGLFVCDANNIEISECFQPSSLNPELEPGQQFVEFSEQVVDISEEPILNKSTSALFGYTRGRLATTLEFRYTNPEFQATQREQLNYLTNLVIIWDIGPRTDLRTRISYAENYQQSQNINQEFEDTIISASTALRYRVNEKMSTELEMRILDRDSDNTSRIVRDRRLALTLRYDF